MEVWSQGRKFGERVQFLCVCVESVRVAKSFANMFGFSKITNGFIPSNDCMPRGFGQLGCSGYVVVNGQGQFLSPKTTSFLQVGEMAFRDVETILLDALKSEPFPDPPSPDQQLHADYPYSVGSIAVLDGLKKQPDLNGSQVTILEFDTRSGRFSVELCDETKRRLAILPCSLAPLSACDTKAKDPEGVDDIGRIEAINAPPSVGIESMDHEHESCTEAINALLAAAKGDGAAPSLLQCLIDELDDHFAHEEMLMKDYKFGGSGGQEAASSFSAFSSHVNDHQRILDIARNEMTRLKQQEDKDSQQVSLKVAQAVAHAFHLHADRFDSLYASHIPQSAA